MLAAHQLVDNVAFNDDDADNLPLVHAGGTLVTTTKPNVLYVRSHNTGPYIQPYAFVLRKPLFSCLLWYG